jgi:hypothetical protein
VQHAQQRRGVERVSHINVNNSTLLMNGADNANPWAVRSVQMSASMNYLRLVNLTARPRECAALLPSRAGIGERDVASDRRGCAPRIRRLTSPGITSMTEPTCSQTKSPQILALVDTRRFRTGQPGIRNECHVLSPSIARTGTRSHLSEQDVMRRCRARCLALAGPGELVRLELQQLSSILVSCCWRSTISGVGTLVSRGVPARAGGELSTRRDSASKRLRLVSTARAEAVNAPPRAPVVAVHDARRIALRHALDAYLAAQHRPEPSLCLSARMLLALD